MGLHPDLRGRRYLVLPTGRSVFVGGVGDRAPAKASRCRNLSDRQPGLVGRHDGPDPFLLRLGQPCGRRAQSGGELLFVSDTLSECFTSFHGLENTRVSLRCPVNWTGSRTFLLQFFRKAGPSCRWSGPMWRIWGPWGRALSASSPIISF